MIITEEKECRVCKGELERVLDLGDIYPSAFISDKEDVSADMKVPLILDRCKECGLIQLEHTVDLDLMYRQYWYSSSLNKSMVSSLQDVVNDIEKKIKLNTEDLVVDIGANDCTMLGLYSNKEIWTMGFEPALNISPKENSVLIWVPDYFSKEAYYAYLNHPYHKEWGEKKAKVVTAIAMFYDLPDPNKFVEDVKEILHDDGIFVIQFTDLVSMLKATAFDNICHEHLEYYRLEDVVNLVRKHELDVIDVSYNEVNGGSVRITAAHKGRYSPKSSVFASIVAERKYLENDSIEKFKDRIESVKYKLGEFLSWQAYHGHRVFLLGASTKGNSLLQICQVTEDDVPFAAEVNKEKLGLRTVGSNIKIISEEEALIKHPDVFIVPVWHFKGFFIRNKRILDYLRAGGRLLFPLPYFHLVYADYNGNVQEVRI